MLKTERNPVVSGACGPGGESVSSDRFSARMRRFISAHYDACFAPLFLLLGFSSLSFLLFFLRLSF